MAKKSYYKKLKKTRYGSIVLPTGERITPTEQKRLRSAVRSANKERSRLIELIPEKDKLKKQQYKQFDKHSDFIYRHKSYGIRRFKSKKEFTSYLHNVERLADTEKYADYIGGIYKDNYIKSIQKVFNSSGDEIINFVKNEISNREIIELSLSGELETIGFVYYEQQAKKEKLAKLKNQVERLRKRKS